MLSLKIQGTYLRAVSQIRHVCHATKEDNMKRILALSALSIFACSAVMAESPAKFEKSQAKAPNNTAKNKRDKKLGKPTAQNQSNTKSDLDITIALRKDIMANKMSVDAQNIKIITENGILYLRGPVANEKEKDMIGGWAKNSCGARAITNQLEVKGQTSQKSNP